MGMRNTGFWDLTNSNNKKTRINSKAINNGSDMKPEKVSTISGETARIIEAIRLSMRLSKARKLSNPTVKILIENSTMSNHLAVRMKSPLTGVKRLRIKGKSGGNSVTGVIEPLEFRIVAPLPA